MATYKLPDQDKIYKLTNQNVIADTVSTQGDVIHHEGSVIEFFWQEVVGTWDF